MNASRTQASRSDFVLAFGLYTTLVLALFLPLVRCIDACYVDLASVHGQQLGAFELADVRLHTWILAWVQHALPQQPLELFAANTFYPFSAALAGSEHTLGLALLTLPVRLFTANAVLIFQVALLLSSLLMALTTFALVRWLTGSHWAALVVGATAIFMPWRMAELSHIQLLGAHWFPLVWLLAMRILMAERRPLDVPLLVLVLCLQLLTSYYLSYLLTLSLAVLILVTTVVCGADRRALARLGATLATAYGAFALVSIPYLMRRARGELDVAMDPNAILGPDVIGRAWAYIAPRLAAGWTLAAETAPTYSVPLVIALLAAASMLTLAPARAHPGDNDRRQRAMTVALWISVASAFVLMFGGRIGTEDGIIRLPGYWAAKIVPGLGNIRAPHRWGILIGVAMPVLAGIGIHQLWGVLRPDSGSRTTSTRRLLAAGVLGTSLIIGVPWRQLPAKAAWSDPQVVEAAYAALRRLPSGPVIEIPWHMQPLAYLATDTQYMVASTLHWRPIFNGFTAYLPPTFKLLRRIAQGLPAADTVAALSRLTDVRWIVVHVDRLPEHQRRRWQQARTASYLELAHADANTLIFEVPAHKETGMWMAAMRSTAERDATVTGLPRSPLDHDTADGHLRAVVPAHLPRGNAAGPQARINLSLTNLGDTTWAGLDYQTQGLIMLRYVFSRGTDDLAHSGIATLDVDVAPGATVAATSWISTPREDGRYRLCFDLVQNLDGELVALPIEPRGHAVTVVGSGPTRPNAFDAVRVRPTHPDYVPEGVSPCAALWAKRPAPIL